MTLVEDYEVVIISDDDEDVLSTMEVDIEENEPEPEQMDEVPKPTKRRFSCLLCDAKNFNVLATFREHLKTQHDGFRCECPECGKRFEQVEQLNKHALTYDKKIFACKVCSRAFNNYRRYTCHVERHDRERSHACEFCDKKFKCKEYLNIHLILHQTKPTMECDYCGERFTKKAKLQYHMIRKHTERKFQCDECPKKFHLVGHLKQHKVLHEPDKFVCEICKTTFKRKQTYDYHTQSHKKEKLSGVRSNHVNRRKGEIRPPEDETAKKFECNVCAKRFKYSYILRDHLCTHIPKVKPFSEESKKYECPMCDRKFLTPFLLYQHKKSKTLHNRFECKVCAVVIYGEKIYSKHMEAHGASDGNEK